MNKLAIVGIGDVRRQDKGVTIYLLDKLQQMLSKVDISFIQIKSAGQELSDLLSTIQADKVLILDTDREVVESGKLNYLKLTLNDDKSFQELLVVTIGILSDEWGKKLSGAISKNFFEILQKVFNLACGLLE